MRGLRTPWKEAEERLGPHLHPLRKEGEINTLLTGTHRARLTGLLVTNITIITIGFHGALGWDLKGFTSQVAFPEQLPTQPLPGRSLETQPSIPPPLTFHQYASDKVPGTLSERWSVRMQAAGFPESRHPARDQTATLRDDTRRCKTESKFTLRVPGH